MTPKPSLSSHLVAEATPEELARQWAAIEARLSQRQKPRRMLPLSLALVGVASAALIWVATHRTPSERSWTSGNEPLPIALDDGSHVQLQPRSDISLLRQRKSGVSLRVARGGARFEVRHDPVRRFQVTAAGVDVVVTGTIFSVEVEAGLGTPRVSVERGEVEVHPQGEARLLARLHADETWPPRPAPSITTPEKLAPPVAAPSLEAQPSPPSVAPAAPPPPASSGRHSVPADARQLLEQANAARRIGDVAQAASLFETLRVRYPRDPRAALASFELGRLRLDLLGDLPGAVQALKQSIALAPSGVFREDAEACLATAYARMRDRPRCELARRSYLDRYPEGTHATEMSALGCQ